MSSTAPDARVRAASNFLASPHGLLLRSSRRSLELKRAKQRTAAQVQLQDTGAERLDLTRRVSGSAPQPGAAQPSQESTATQPESDGMSFGFDNNFEADYQLCDEIGKGGNATVYLAIARATGKRFACKVLPKVLKDPSASELKRVQHPFALRREVEVLRRLRGSLNVACLERAYEGADSIFLVIDLCEGGGLVDAIGSRHYSERTVASYMRAVLRTLAQCHSAHILHRDVKPGNFMLANGSGEAPLKAIDFGLAAPFDPADLPRQDLGLEGTPWYMAPEVLSSEVTPASDLWSAGVMAHQLLTGRFPFDDKRTPANPSISRIWHSILTDKLDLKRSYWSGVSEDGKDFVRSLLQREPGQRPTAKQALQHPWLRGGTAAERGLGRPLSLSVVQRIQRFAGSSAFKRTVLEHIAADLVSACLTRNPPGSAGSSQHGSSVGGSQHGSQHGRLRFAGAATESSRHGPASSMAGSPGRTAPQDCPLPTSCPLGSAARPIIAGPRASPLLWLYSSMSFEEDDSVSREQAAQGLQKMGYRVGSAEMHQLLDSLDVAHSGRIHKSQLAASQIDWRELQEDHAEQWLASVQRVFEEFDGDHDGVIAQKDIIECLRGKLPPSEVQAAVEQAMQEAKKRDGSIHEGLSFEGFLRMLRTNSSDSLDQFDDRMSSCAGSYDRLNSLLEKSVRGGDSYTRAAVLDPVVEAN